MNLRYASVAQRAGHRCEYCYAPEVIFNFPFEVEHITPLARDGADAEHNWALSCRSCNLYKFTHIEANDPESGKTTRLFHPREDRWEEHFSIDQENGYLEGVTAVGRATAVCLKMNNPLQVSARQRWVQLGLFP